MLPEVSSTNSHALHLAQSNAVHGTVVVAERQTAGRGRFDRSWFSPSGLNLYASIILRPLFPFSHMSWIPLVTGLALTKAIHQTSGLRSTLKWPNDLLWNERKLGGILCEGSSQGPDNHFVIIGVGVNVNMTDLDFPEDLRPVSTSIRISTQRLLNRNTLLASILNAMETLYEQLLSGQIDPIHQAYTAQCGTLGRDLLVQLTNKEEFFARAYRIGKDGSLHVSLKHTPDHAIRVIHSGEVTHMKSI